MDWLMRRGRRDPAGGGRNQPAASSSSQLRQPNWPEIIRNNQDDQKVIEFAELDKAEPFVQRDGYLPILSAAADQGRLSLIEKLLAKGYRPEQREDVISAATRAPMNMLAIMERFLNTPKAVDVHGLQPAQLLSVILPQNPPIAFLNLLREVTLPSRPDFFEGTVSPGTETPLLMASRMGSRAVVDWLLKLGVTTKVNAQGMLTVSPLMYAVNTGNVELVKLLYQHDPAAASAPAAYNAQGEFAGRSAFTLAELKPNKKELLAAMGASTRDLDAEEGNRSYTGNLWTCGSNTWNQSNSGGKKECALHTPAVVGRDEEVQQVACGYFHTLVLLKNGRVFAFGKADEGQLGVMLRPQDAPKTHTVRFLSDKQVASIAAGKFHSAALLLDGSVICWGQRYPSSGQTIQLKEPVVQVACSSYNTFMVDASGHVWCSNVRSDAPMKIEQLPLEGIQKVACGLFHSVALSNLGDVYMWSDDQPQPVLIDFFAGRAVCDVAAGQIRTYAVTEAGEVYLWERDPVKTPVALAMPTGPEIKTAVIRGPELVRELQNVNVVRIACGDGFTLALTHSWAGETKVYSWGNNNYGQLGRPTAGTRDDVPAPIQVEGEFNDIACGGFHFALCGGRFMGARSSLASDLLSALQSKYLADFTFTLANGTAIKAHKLLLLSRVPTFVKELPDANAAIVPAEITTSDADFLAVLGFLYGGRVSMTQASCRAYLKIAAYLQIGVLIRNCMRRVNMGSAELADLVKTLPLGAPARHLVLNSPQGLVQQVGLDNVLFSPDLSDITFIVEGTRRRAHRWVVAARCPYWRALWASGMRESAQTELELKLRLPVFDAVMHFVYTDLTNSVNEETCFEVLGQASEWQLDKLKNACESFMIMGLDAENAESMLEHADLYSAARLQRAAKAMLKGRK